MLLIGAGIVAILLLLALLVVLLGRLDRRLGELSARVPDPALSEALSGLPDRVAGSVSATVSRTMEPRLADLGARLDSLGGAVEELLRREPEVPPPPRFAEEVGPLLEEAVDSLEARIREVIVSLESRRDEGVAESVERGLLERGFGEVRIVDGPSFEGERTRVVVSARREGMTYKGAVLLSGRRIVDERLSPAYPMFP
jgi:hypothetical protein